MKDFLSTFTNFKNILCICPKCNTFSRLNQLHIISTKKTPPTWFDRYEKKQSKLQIKVEDFKSKEKAIRDEGHKRAHLKLPKMIKSTLSTQITSLRFNPFDIKPILHPVDFVVYDGMEKESIDNVIFLHNKSKNANMRALHKSIHTTVEKKEYDWKVARVSRSTGKLEIE